MIETYFRQVEVAISDRSIIVSSMVTYDKRSPYVGFIRGSIYFLDNSVLHFREFINVQQTTDRYMYVYHYQQVDNTLIFRYDNTPHFPGLSTFPHHKHVGSEANVVAATAPEIQSVLDEIEEIILQNQTL